MEGIKSCTSGNPWQFAKVVLDIPTENNSAENTPAEDQMSLADMKKLISLHIGFLKENLCLLGPEDIAKYDGKFGDYQAHRELLNGVIPLLHIKFIKETTDAYLKNRVINVSDMKLSLGCVEDLVKYHCEFMNHGFIIWHPSVLYLLDEQMDSINVLKALLNNFIKQWHRGNTITYMLEYAKGYKPIDTQLHNVRREIILQFISDILAQYHDACRKHLLPVCQAFIAGELFKIA